MTGPDVAHAAGVSRPTPSFVVGSYPTARVASAHAGELRETQEGWRAAAATRHAVTLKAPLT